MTPSQMFADSHERFSLVSCLPHPEAAAGDWAKCTVASSKPVFFFIHFFIQTSYIMSLTLMLFLLFCFPLYPLWHVKALSWYDATILKEHIMDLWQRSMHPCSTQTVTANINNLVLLQTAVGHNVARLVNGTVSSTEVFQIMCTSILTSSRLVI